MFFLSFSAYKYLSVAPFVSATNVQGFKVTADLNDSRGKGTPTFFQLQYRVRKHFSIVCNTCVSVIWHINNSAGIFDMKVFSWLKRITQNTVRGLLCLLSCNVAWIKKLWWMVIYKCCWTVWTWRWRHCASLEHWWLFTSRYGFRSWIYNPVIYFCQ